jgi:hypothetical protein
MACCDSCKHGKTCESGGKKLKESAWRYGFTLPLESVEPGRKSVVKGSNFGALYSLPGSAGIKGLGSPARSVLAFHPVAQWTRGEVRQISQLVDCGGDRVW